MKIVIAGGGNVGYYLAKTLCEHRHKVSIVDQSQTRCSMIDCSSFGRKIAVICGDGTDEKILREAGVENCDVFIAVTGQDQNNLAACMLAKERLKAARTVSRVNNPKNIRVFQQLGVDSVISSAARIVDIIEQELDWGYIDSILAEKTDNARIRRFLVDGGSFAAGKNVAKLRLPQGTIVIVVVRGSRAFIPNGGFGLEVGDEVILMGSESDLDNAGVQFYEEVSE